MTGKDLKTYLSDPNFLLTGAELREYGSVKFSTPEEAREFRTRYLTLKCVSGLSYSPQELITVYHEVKKLAHLYRINFKDLPFLPLKAEHLAINDVKYVIDGCYCKIERNCV